MGKVDDRVVSRSVRQLAKFNNQTIAKPEEIHGIERVADVAATFPDGGGPMNNRLIAVDQHTMHCRTQVHVIDMPLSESFPHGFLTDNLARISCISPRRLGKDDYVGRKIYKHPINIAGHSARKYRFKNVFYELSVDLT